MVACENGGNRSAYFLIELSLRLFLGLYSNFFVVSR